MAIVVSSKVILLKAIHLSPVGQSQRLRPAPANKSDPSMRKGETKHIPHMYYIRQLPRLDHAPVLMGRERFVRKKAPRVSFGERRF
jgi:hypothetical protein